MIRFFSILAATLLAGAVLASQVQAKTVARTPHHRMLVAPSAQEPESMWVEDYFPLSTGGSCTYRGGPKSIDWSCW